MSKRKHINSLIIVLTLTTLFGCSFDTARFFEKNENTLQPIEAQYYQFQELWQVNTGSGSRDHELRIQPAIAGNIIYTIDITGRLTAIQRDSGQKIWQQRFEVGKVIGGLSYAFGNLYFSTDEALVLSVSAQDGQIRWTAEISSEALAPIAADEHFVIIQTNDGKLFALNALNGKRLWVYDRNVPVLSLRGHSAPQIYNNKVISGFSTGKVAVFSLDDGLTQWERRIALPTGKTEIERLIDIDADPLVYRGVLFAASYQGFIAAINLTNGHEIWHQSASTSTGISHDNQNIYVSGADDSVSAFGLNRGTPMWKNTDLAHRQISAPTVINSCVIVGDHAGFLHCIDTNTGKIVGQTRVSSGAIKVAPLTIDNNVYVYTQQGTLAAYRLTQLQETN